MKKQEFLTELKKQLQGLPKEDIEDRISFYSEAIDDRIDEGKSEEEAVADVGTIDEIVNDIAKDTPLAKLVKEKVKPKRSLTGLEILLLVLGFPLWFPLLVTALALCLVAYLLIWVLVIVVYSVEIAFVAGAIGSLVGLFAALFLGGSSALLASGALIMCTGAAIVFIFACIAVTKGTLKLSRRIINRIKTWFIKKGSKE